MSIQLREEDQLFYQRYLHDFVPDRVYDAHTHAIDLSRCSAMRREQMTDFPEVLSLKVIRDFMNWLHPGRDYAGTFFGDPWAEDLAGQNDFVSQEIRANPRCRGHFCVRPTDDPDWVSAEVK